MRNILLSYPKSGKNRLELLLILFLTQYIGTASPVGWSWLRYWVKVTHFGFHNINIPDLPEMTKPTQYPIGANINILLRDPVAILCSMYRWYKVHPPEDSYFKSLMEGGLTLDDYALSEWGVERLIKYAQMLQMLVEQSTKREYLLRFYRYEDTFKPFFIFQDIPRILNLDYRLNEMECQWIIDHSSVEYVKRVLTMKRPPDGYTNDIIAGIKIGMRGGHIQIGDPEGHKDALSPDVEAAIRDLTKGTIL